MATRSEPRSAPEPSAPARRLAFLAARTEVVVQPKRGGHVSCTVGGKVFAFTRADGLVLKLPGDVVEELLDRDRAVRLVMGKRVMKEWIVLADSPANTVAQTRQLVDTAIASVRPSGGGRA